MFDINSIFSIIILIFSVIAHEISHGFAAYHLGDKTAYYAGRLTMNPIKHLDLFGSIILPLILVISHSPVGFGWAKPVPYNPENIKNKRWGTLFIASAGIIMNFFIACVFGMLLRASFVYNFATEGLTFILAITVMTNIGLGLFNLIPVAPLDGSKILFSILPKRFAPVFTFLERYSFFILILLLVLLSLQKNDILSQAIVHIFTLITGLAIN